MSSWADTQCDISKFVSEYMHEERVRYLGGKDGNWMYIIPMLWSVSSVGSVMCLVVSS